MEMGLCVPTADAMRCDVMRGLVLGNECAVVMCRLLPGYEMCVRVCV